MSKPIYLDQDLCTKLQSKGLECGSGMWWTKDRYGDIENLSRDYIAWLEEDDNKPELICPCYELHIDILGSRENLVKIVTDYYQIKEFSHGLLSLIHDGFPDQAINLIKEAV